MSTSTVRNADIAFYQSRVARDPYGARDRAALAALYLARGRANNDPSDFARAESLATVSLATRHKRNGDAVQVLVGAMMAQHRFAEAAQVMQHDADLSEPLSRATLGEIDLELGRYPAADSLFQSLTLLRTQPAIAPRYARWLELNGQSGEARELLLSTRATLEHGFRIPPEQLAWFDLRLGELAQRNGRYDLASESYDRGLSLVADDARLLAASARLAAARQDWSRAITLGEGALGGSFEPGTLGLLSEAYAATGDTARAAEYARAMEVSLSQQPGAYHRGWALFLLDHHRQVDRVLQRAQQELATRKDVYGYDVVAWAFHQAGQDRAARTMADSALTRGTRDPMLYYHRGLIVLALADTSAARRDLDHAVAIDPGYRPGHGPSAADVLSTLDRR
jgi:tetratricopeptide (TPR) repeat protein